MMFTSEKVVVIKYIKARVQVRPYAHNSLNFSKHLVMIYSHK